MDLVTVICHKTQESFASIAGQAGSTANVDAAIATDIMREVIKDRYDGVVADLREALDANLNNAWLQVAINAACMDLANDAWNRYRVRMQA